MRHTHARHIHARLICMARVDCTLEHILTPTSRLLQEKMPSVAEMHMRTGGCLPHSHVAPAHSFAPLSHSHSPSLPRARPPTDAISPQTSASSSTQPSSRSGQVHVCSSSAPRVPPARSWGVRACASRGGEGAWRGAWGADGGRTAGNNFCTTGSDLDLCLHVPADVLQGSGGGGNNRRNRQREDQKKQVGRRHLWKSGWQVGRADSVSGCSWPTSSRSWGIG